MRRPNVEFVGTFLPVFSGPGAMIVNEVSGGSVDSLGIGLSFDLAVMATIYSVGDFSGIRINPAVTLAFAVTRHFLWSLVPPYLASQLLGACVASANLATAGATPVRRAGSRSTSQKPGDGSMPSGA